MKEREYDLVNELGPGNWLDAVAGEAVVLGFAMRDPDLEMRGTYLARLIAETPYDHDGFGRVEAYAIGLMEKISRELKKQKNVLKIEEIYRGVSEFRRSSCEWEYDFVYAEGRYQVQMILPVYYDGQKLNEAEKKMAEKVARSAFTDPSFESCRVSEVYTDYVTQGVTTRSFWDGEKLVRRTVLHNHEDGCSHGWRETYYFDDFETAMKVWRVIRKIV